MKRESTLALNDRDRGGPRTSVDLLELLWRRRACIVWCTILGIALGVIYCAVATTMYESSADVLVVHKSPQVVTGDRPYESGFEDYLATHLAIIASPLIVERAIAASDLGSLDCFADIEDPEEDLVDAIIDNLEVDKGSRDLGDSADSIMTLAFRCSVAEDCPIVVQALVDSYEAFHAEVYTGMSNTAVVLIQQARDLLKSDLAEQEQSYNSFRQNSPLVARGTDEVNPLQDRLTAIEQQRSELLLRRAEIERQSMALKQAREDGSDFEQLLGIVSELRQLNSTENGLPDVSTTLENQLIQLADDEKKLLEHYGPNHPHVDMIRKRIAATRLLFALPTTAHMQQAENNLSDSSSGDSDPVAAYSRYLEQELKRLKISEDLLTDLYDREHDAAKEHSAFQLKDESYQRNIERTEQLYDVVVSQLQEASLVKDYGGFETRIIAPPKLGTKVSPSRRLILPAAAFAGMLLGCFLALAFELRDEGFQSCDQVQEQLGLPVVGRVPHIAVSRHNLNDASRDRVLCTYHEPRSLSAQSFRALRTNLFHNGHQENTRVIQVTGPSVDDGASTVAANLAISLAQTGKRVLLIDADLCQPRQHKMFAVPDSLTGLAGIVGSDVEPADVICKTAVENLWLLPAGVLPSGPCEVFTSPKFGELIKWVRDSYDYVLIDTEPMSVASDSCIIASQSDGVLLTLSLTGDSRRRSRQAIEMLDQLDVNILGVVVNRLRGAIHRQRSMTRRDYALRRQAQKTATRLGVEPTVTASD